MEALYLNRGNFPSVEKLPLAYFERVAINDDDESAYANVARGSLSITP